MKINQRRMNGEGSTLVKQKGRRLYQRQIRIKVDGKSKRFSVYGKTRGELRDKVNELKRQIKANELKRQIEAGLRPSDDTMAEYLGKWYGEERETELRPSTVLSRQININRMLPYIGSIKLTKIDHTAIKKMQKYLLEKYSRKTVALTHRILVKALNDAVADDLILRNPCGVGANVKVKAPSIEKKKVMATSDQILTVKERDDLVGIRDAWTPLFTLLSFLGLRRGEALGLQWKHVNFKSERLSIKQQLLNHNGQLSLGPPKTDESVRDINMPRRVVDELKAKKDRVRFVKGREVSNDDMVFPGILQDRVNRNLTRSLKSIGIDRKIRVHDLRHTAASIMIQAGASPKAVQEILGHANISITMDLYVHTDEKMLKRAVELGDPTYVATL